MINAEAVWWNDSELLKLLSQRPELFPNETQVFPKAIVRSHHDLLRLAHNVFANVIKRTQRFGSSEEDSSNMPREVRVSPVSRDGSQLCSWTDALHQPSLLMTGAAWASPVYDADQWCASVSSDDTSSVAQTEASTRDAKKQFSVASVVCLASFSSNLNSPRENQRLANARMISGSGDPPLPESDEPFMSSISDDHSAERLSAPSSVAEALSQEVSPPIVRRECYVAAWRWLHWALEKRCLKRVKVRNDLRFLFTIIHRAQKRILIAKGYNNWIIIDKAATWNSKAAIARSDALELINNQAHRVFKLSGRAGKLTSSVRFTPNLWLVIVGPEAEVGIKEEEASCPIICLEDAAASSGLEATTQHRRYDLEINLPSYSIREFATFLKYSPVKSGLEEIDALFGEFGTKLEAYSNELVGMTWSQTQSDFARLCQYKIEGVNLSNLIVHNHLFSVFVNAESVVIHNNRIIPFRLFGWSPETSRFYHLLRHGYPAAFVSSTMYKRFVRSVLMTPITLSRATSGTCMKLLNQNLLLGSGYLRGLLMSGEAHFILNVPHPVNPDLPGERRSSNGVIIHGGGSLLNSDDLSPFYKTMGLEEREEMSSPSTDCPQSTVTRMVLLRPTFMCQPNARYTNYAKAIMDGVSCFLVQHRSTSGLTLGRVVYVADGVFASTLGELTPLLDRRPERRITQSTAGILRRPDSLSQTSITSGDTSYPSLEPLVMTINGVPARNAKGGPKRIVAPLNLYEDSLSGVGVVLRNADGIESTPTRSSQTSAPHIIMAPALPLRTRLSLPDPRLHDMHVTYGSHDSRSDSDSMSRSQQKISFRAESMESSRDLPKEDEDMFEVPAAPNTRMLVELFHLDFWPYWSVQQNDRALLLEALTEGLPRCELTEYACQVRREHSQAPILDSAEAAPALQHRVMEAVVCQTVGDEVAILLTSCAQNPVASKIVTTERTDQAFANAF